MPVGGKHQYQHHIFQYLIHHAVLLGYRPAPEARQVSMELLRVAGACAGVLFKLFYETWALLKAAGSLL